MKVAAIAGARKGGLIDKADPHSKEDIVVIKIHSAPMCTEYHAYRDGGVSDCLGHEAAGEVVDADVSNRVRVGDRVIVQPQYACGKCMLCLQGDHIHCQNQRDVRKITGSEVGTATLAQYMLKPDYLLTPIPEGMSYDHASMACCGLGPTFGAMQLMDVDAFDTVLITGLGPVGLGGVINARYRGARVIGVESNPYRSQLAKELGATAVIDPMDPDSLEQLRALTNGKGPDKCIDTSGSEKAKGFLMDAVRRKGKIAFVGWGGQVEVNTIISKGLSLYGAWHYNLHDVSRLLQVITWTNDAIEHLITHRFPLSQISGAWELQLKGECGKIVLHPWE
jgi:threonine dehydrogenase-like Zn-dependent dehydrogenase